MDEGFDADQDESTTCGGDCDDNDREVSPGQSERCDGKDNNCDGYTDNGVDPQPCPLDGGVCEGAESNCLPDGTWSACDYGPEYTPGTDGSCDGQDHDCDGHTDEDVVVLLVPEVGVQATDGLDNNCNGLVDEPGGVMVPIAEMPGVWIDAFEVAVFDNPGCEGDHFGQALDDYPPGWPASGQADVTLYACSLPGVIPSGHLSWYRAQRACQAQGKDLCTMTQWSTGCYGDILQNYPYGPQFVPHACNDAFGDQQVAQTGSLPDCVSASGVYDQSGNLAEWILNGEEESCPGVPLAVGFHYRCEFCTCGAEEPRAYLGNRCCYEPD